MKRVLLALAVAGCAHAAAPIHLAPPRTVIVAPHHCVIPPAPVLPNNATAAGLTEAVDRLAARDKARADYERQLIAALKACR